MENNLIVNNIEYFRGINGSLYYSVQFVLNNSQTVFYNSELNTFVCCEKAKELFKKILANKFKIYDIPNNKEEIAELVEILKEDCTL